MTGTNPERGDTGVQTRFTAPFRGIVDAGVSIANCVREWYEIGQLEKRSRRYVDALVDCYVTGGITGKQITKGLSLDDERINSLGLSRHAINSHAFHRLIRLRLCGN